MSGFLAFTTKMLKRYGRGGMLLLLLQAVTVAIQIVVMPFLARLLTPSEFGIFQFSQNLITWFSIFSVGNSTLAAKKGMVENKNGTMLYAFLYRLKFMAVLCALSFAAAGVFFLFGKPILPELSMIVGLFLLFGYLAQVSFPQLFIAKENFGLFVFWQSVAIFVSQACTLAVAYTTKNVTLVIFAQYASMALICGLAFAWGLKKYHCIAAYKKGEIDRSCIDYGKKLIPVEILQGTAGSIHNFIIGPLFGFASLAVFSIATRIDVLFRSVVSSGYYLLYADFAKIEISEIRHHLKQKLFFIFFSSSLVSLGLFFVSWVYIVNFLPAAYTPAIVYIGILVCALPAVVLQGIMQSAMEAKLKAEDLRFATFLSQILRIVFLVVGGFFGIVGITISLTVSAWVGVLCFAFVFYEFKFLEKNVLKKHFKFLK